VDLQDRNSFFFLGIPITDMINLHVDRRLCKFFGNLKLYENVVVKRI